MNINNIFNKNGYVQIPKDESFAEFLASIVPAIKELCPNYEEEKLLSGSYSLLDTALQHRLEDKSVATNTGNS